MNGLNARVDVNCGRKDGRTDGQNTRRLYRTLLKQVQQKISVCLIFMYFPHIKFQDPSLSGC